METTAWTASHRAFQSLGIGIHSPSTAKEIEKTDKQTQGPGTISSSKTDLQVGGKGLEQTLDDNFIHYPAEGHAVTPPNPRFMPFMPHLLCTFPRLPPS